jgi:hypothetical protein
LGRKVTERAVHGQPWASLAAGKGTGINGHLPAKRVAWAIVGNRRYFGPSDYLRGGEDVCGDVTERCSLRGIGSFNDQIAPASHAAPIEHD